jgi:hypothetical protein
VVSCKKVGKSAGGLDRVHPQDARPEFGFPHRVLLGVALTTERHGAPQVVRLLRLADVAPAGAGRGEADVRRVRGRLPAPRRDAWLAAQECQKGIVSEARLSLAWSLGANPLRPVGLCRLAAAGLDLGGFRDELALLDGEAVAATDHWRAPSSPRCVTRRQSAMSSSPAETMR